MRAKPLHMGGGLADALGAAPNRMRK